VLPTADDKDGRTAERQLPSVGPATVDVVRLPFVRHGVAASVVSQHLPASGRSAFAVTLAAAHAKRVQVAGHFVRAHWFS